jgi:ATP-binding cassette subfamily F protein 2
LILTINWFREVPIPEHIDIYLLKEEYPPTEKTALTAVIEDAAAELKVFTCYIS